jgi:flavin reductase (DIM6/NTAB) family NADH-FMN oxidoreductase RutF
MALATRRPHPAAAAGDVAAALRHFVSGVAVLTCGVGDATEGVTVSTLSTIPGAPSRVCVALRSGSRGLRALAHSPAFVANSLAAGPEPLARHFARRSRSSGLGQLPPEAWLGDPAGGVPRLSGAVAWLECRPELTVPLSDHELVVARVVSAVHGSGAPLVNFAGELHPGPSTPTSHHGERD